VHACRFGAQHLKHLQPLKLSPSPRFQSQAFTLRKCFGQEEVLAFLHATGDTNPLHVDVAAAAAAGVLFLMGTYLSPFFSAGGSPNIHP
jgi:acyl dehydratase